MKFVKRHRVLTVGLILVLAFWGWRTWDGHFTPERWADTPISQRGKLVDSLLEQAKEPAACQVKMDLAVGAIIKAEGLEATDEDVDAEYEKMAKQYGMEAEEIKKYMDAEVIREQVLRDKAIRVVVDSAVAVEPVIQAEEPAQAPAEEAPAEEKPKAKRTRKKKTAEEPAEASESAPEAAE